MNSNNQSSLIGSSMPDFFRRNRMILVFSLLAVFFFIVSGDGADTIARDISIRFFRNLLLVLSLIFPIMAGIGLNFGIVLGAMSAQISLIVVIASGLDKIGVGYHFWVMFTVVFSIVSGYLLALLYNKTKKQEMIAGLLVGFFANGIYMFILMVILGTIIKLSDPALVAMYGAPIKMTVEVPRNMYAAVDNAFPVSYYYVFIIAYIALMVFLVFTLIKNIRGRKNEILRGNQSGIEDFPMPPHTHKRKCSTGKVLNPKTTSLVKIISTTVKIALVSIAFVFGMLNNTVLVILVKTNMPFLTCIIGVVFILFVWRIMRSKLGHDFLAVQNDIGIAEAAGINVDRIRMIAIALSTTMAGLGQIIFLQNLGSFIVYQTHVTIPTFTIAALLLGGATVKYASIKNAVIGNVLFQAIYSSAPNAAKTLLGNPQIGEYFRTSLSYGAIAVAIVLYAMNETKNANLILKKTT
ncbi:MAG: hypothetical protein LBR97_01430 [Dysgonamonadaceae bacterium]|nr:hypothetical protein [Dysgonamonadaceae bacterium]